MDRCISCFSLNNKPHLFIPLPLPEEKNPNKKEDNFVQSFFFHLDTLVLSEAWSAISDVRWSYSKYQIEKETGETEKHKYFSYIIFKVFCTPISTKD